MSDDSRYIIVTSDEPWSDIWHTQLHYAYQLSKTFRVFYVDPPLPWKPGNLINFSTEVRSVSDTLTVIRYKNWIPATVGRAALLINDWVNKILVKKVMRKSGTYSRLIIWHFDPYRFLFNFRKNRNVKHIHHVIDPVAGFHYDEEMAAKADMVVVTSPKFLEHYHSLNKNTIRIGQGADLEFFKKKFNNETLRAQPSWNSIMLLGTFSDEIDYRLLQLIAEKYPGKLVLIGPDKTDAEGPRQTIEKLKKTPGVTWMGPMNPEAFHMHLLACRVGIITYTFTNYERNNLRSPLKVISYLACGKSIISNIDCEIPQLTNKAIYIVDNDDAYFRMIDESYGNRLYFDDEKVKEYLESIDYRKLIDSIFRKLDESSPDKR